MSNNNSLRLPTLLKQTRVFEESLIKIQRDQLQIDQQPPYDYYTLVTRPAAVVILARTKEGDYVLTEEYRHPTGHFLLSCPGGYVETSEDFLVAAERELLEETGFQAQTFTLIGSAYPYAGISGQKTYYVQALEASYKQSPHLEKSEIIKVCLMRPEQLEHALQTSPSLDGTLCTALFFQQQHQKN